MVKRKIGDTYEIEGSTLTRIPFAREEHSSGVRVKVARQRMADLRFEHERILMAGDPSAELASSERSALNAIEHELRVVSAGLEFDEEQIGRATRGHSGSLDADEERAASALPPVPMRTRAAIDRLFPDRGAASAANVAESFRDVLAAVLGGQPMHAVIRAATATEGVPIDGGFAVMPTVAEKLFRRGIEESVWLRIGARLEPMESEEKLVLALDDDDETQDQEANLKANWKAEAASATPQIMKLRQIRLRANKLMVLAAVSSELQEDAGPDYVTQLYEALGRAIGKKFDRSVLSGPGAGAPLGLLNAPATVQVSKTAGGDPGAAGTFTWVHATEMWARLAPGSHENAWWLMHPTVLPQGLRMSMVIGTAGAIPAAAFQAGGPTGYQLLGRPVVVTSRCKPLSTAGDVILVDPTQVVIGIRRSFTLQQSDQVYFESDRLAIRGTFRGDAQPAWETPRTLVEGATTVSPYVTLQSR